MSARRTLTRRDRVSLGVINESRPFCHIVKANGDECNNFATFIVTRQDDSQYVVCSTHHTMLCTMIGKRPEAYEPLRIESL